MSNPSNELFFQVSGQTQLFPVEAGLTVGSGDGSTILVKDDAVSAEHAVVLEMAGQTLLQALASGESTRILNGEEVVETLERNQCHPLTVGLSVMVGRSRLDVVNGQGAVQNGAAPADLDGEATIMIESPKRPAAAAHESDLDGDATIIGGPPASTAALDGDATIIQGGALDGDATIIQGGALDGDATIIHGGALDGDATIVGAGRAPDGAPAAPAPAHSPDEPDTLVRIVGLQASNPRLVFTTPGFQRVEKVNSETYRIGSGRGRSVECELDHPEVSRMHAEVRYQNRSYVIEDFRSHNGTFVNGVEVPAGSEQILEPDSHLRFGSVDAVFVVESDGQGAKVTAEQYKKALERLVVAGKLSAKRAAAVEQEYESRRGNCSPIELLLRDAVDASSWSLAFRDKLPRGGGMLRWWLVGGGAAAVAALTWFLT